MELTTEQEDLILEQYRDDEGLSSKELFNDFVNDNIRELQKDFTEQYENEWEKFCKEQFDIWYEDYKYNNKY